MRDHGWHRRATRPSAVPPSEAGSPPVEQGPTRILPGHSVAASRPLSAASPGWAPSTLPPSSHTRADRRRMIGHGPPVSAVVPYLPPQHSIAIQAATATYASPAAPSPKPANGPPQRTSCPLPTSSLDCNAASRFPLSSAYRLMNSILLSPKQARQLPPHINSQHGPKPQILAHALMHHVLRAHCCSADSPSRGRTLLIRNSVHTLTTFTARLHTFPPEIHISYSKMLPQRRQFLSQYRHIKRCRSYAPNRNSMRVWDGSIHPQPRSGDRIRPMAQAMGLPNRIRHSPRGAKEMLSIVTSVCPISVFFRFTPRGWSCFCLKWLLVFALLTVHYSGDLPALRARRQHDAFAQAKKRSLVPDLAPLTPRMLTLPSNHSHAPSPPTPPHRH